MKRQRIAHKLRSRTYRRRRLGDRVIGQLADWATGRLGNWPIGRLDVWATGRLGDSPIGRLDVWATGRLDDRPFRCRHFSERKPWRIRQAQ